MKRHLIMLFTVLVIISTLFSCADKTLETPVQLSDPLAFSFDINMLLGLSSSSNSEIFLFSDDDSDPSEDIVIGGESLKVLLSFAIVNATTNANIETKEVTSETSPINLSFQPILKGTQIYAELTIKDANEGQGGLGTLFTSKSETISVKTGENTLTLPINPPLFFWNKNAIDDDTHDYTLYKTAFPLAKESAKLNLSSPISDIEHQQSIFSFASDYTTYLYSQGSESPDNMPKVYTINKDGAVSDSATLDPTLLWGENSGVNTAIFTHNDKPMLLYNYFDSGPESDIFVIYDIEEKTKTNVVLDWQLTTGGLAGGAPIPAPTSFDSIKATSLNDEIYLYLEKKSYDSASGKFTVDSYITKLIFTEGEEDNPSTYRSIRIVEPHSLSLNETLVQRLCYSTQDFVGFNDKLILLGRYYEALVSDGSDPTLPVSYGFAAVLDPSNISFSVTQRVGETWNTNAEIPQPENEDDPYFFGPVKVIAITNKRLFIADSGFHTTEPQVDNFICKRRNRIVAMDLNFDLLFQDANVKFNTDPRHSDINITFED